MKTPFIYTKEEYETAKNIWEENLNDLTIEENDVDMEEVEHSEGGINHKRYEHKEDVEITLDYYEEGIVIPMIDFIAYSKEIEHLEIQDEIYCFSNKRCVVLVDSNDIILHNYLSRINADSDAPKKHTYWDNGSVNEYFRNTVNIDGIEYHISIKTGFSIWHISRNMNSIYDKYNPSYPTEGAFIEIFCNNEYINPDKDKEKIYTLINAFIFEVSCTFRIDLIKYPFPLEVNWMDDDENISINEDYRLRPLITKKSMNEVLILYNRAIEITDYEMKLFYLVKVIEYISQTVIRQKLQESAILKLYSPRALSPDSKFIDELKKIFDDFKNINSKDKESIKFTIRTCCDPLEIAHYAPKFLKIATVTSETPINDKDKALDEFSESLSSTRNMIAHAKANYTPTGKECGESDMGSFVNCLKIAAQQCIRWFYLTDDAIKHHG